MKMCLTQIRRFINETAAALKGENNFSPERFGAFIKTLRQSVQQMKHTLGESVFELQDPESVQRMVRSIQVLLTIYSDELVSFLSDPDSFNPYESSEVPSFENLISEAYRTYEEMLRTLEHYYPTAFDTEQLPPVIYSRFKLYQIQLGGKELERMLGIKQVRPEVLEILFSPIREVTEAGSTGHRSYRMLSYLKFYLQAIEGVLEERKIGAELERSVLLVMWRYNVNSEAMLNWCHAYVQERISGFETTEARIEELKEIRRAIVRFEPLRGVALYPGQGSLSRQLAYWVEEELSKLEQRLEDERLEVVEEGSERARLTFNCSAAVVTYLFKLLVDEGVILEQNAMRVIRFIAEGFNTKRRSDLSEHAIHNHYYQERPVTVEKVREMLMGMYKRTR